jgi:hypothetical protein
MVDEHQTDKVAGSMAVVAEHPVAAYQAPHSRPGISGILPVLI